MQASLGAEQSSTTTYLAAAQQGPPHSGTGLRNDIGENNCFLNCFVQSLWHCACFRRAVLQWPLHAYQVSTAAAAAARCSLGAVLALYLPCPLLGFDDGALSAV